MLSDSRPCHVYQFTATNTNGLFIISKRTLFFGRNVQKESRPICTTMMISTEATVSLLSTIRKAPMTHLPNENGKLSRVCAISFLIPSVFIRLKIHSHDVLYAQYYEQSWQIRSGVIAVINQTIRNQALCQQRRQTGDQPSPISSSINDRRGY